MPYYPPPSSGGVTDGDKGDVSVTGGGATWTIDSGAVTEAKQVLADNTTNDVSITKHGYAPKAPNDATKFLRGDATWAVTTLGSNSFQIDASSGSGYGILAGSVNGSNTLFTVSLSSYVSGSLQVYLNGQLQTQGAGNDFVETTPASGTFTFSSAPQSGDIIMVVYKYAAMSSGNADTLDGYEASVFVNTSASNTFTASQKGIIWYTTQTLSTDETTTAGYNGSVTSDIEIATDKVLELSLNTVIEIT